MGLLDTLGQISSALGGANQLFQNINTFGDLMTPNTQSGFVQQTPQEREMLRNMGIPSFPTMPQMNPILTGGFNPDAPQPAVINTTMNTQPPMMVNQPPQQDSFAQRLQNFLPLVLDYQIGQNIAGAPSFDPRSGDPAYVRSMGLQNALQGLQNRRDAQLKRQQQLFENEIARRTLLSNEAYKNALIASANRPDQPKVQSIAGGAFSQIIYPDGRTEIKRNDEVLQFLQEQEKQKRLNESGGLNLTAGQKKVDEVFAKDFISNQDKLLNDKVNLGKITGIMEEIADPDFDATGSIRQKTPLLEDFQKITAIGQKRIDLTDRVNNVVQQSLKTILGGQFAKEEADRLIASYYNPALPEEFNQRRLAELRTQLKEKTDYLDARNKYFIEKGTLNGFNLQPPSAEKIRKEALRIYDETTKDNKNETDKEIERKEDNLVDKLLKLF
tara:strand:+ start:69 stop:1394 length:1326 start_codon:yes stop_codon:yes gene_type:complete